MTRQVKDIKPKYDANAEEIFHQLHSDQKPIKYKLNDNKHSTKKFELEMAGRGNIIGLEDLCLGCTTHQITV